MKASKNPVVYVTKDKERAEGMPESDQYSIVTGDGSMDTAELLQMPETAHIVESKHASVLVFKNNSQIEALVKEKGWKLLNPPASLSEKIENKITQVAWLGDLADLLPPHHITLAKKITRSDDATSVVQWAHSHTGEGTFHIKKESDLKTLQAKFPEREARVTTYIKGPMFTVNTVVADEGVFMGNVSYQITGISPFTDSPFSTVGNDWSVPHTLLTEKHIEELGEMAQKIGKRLQSDGWLGLFGIDAVYDEERDKLFLIEINARQPASTTYESQLQQKAREKGVSGMTTFEAHLAALTHEPVSDLIQINDGAQIIQRVTAATTKVTPKKLEDAGYNVITYTNKKINSDLVRIQSSQGIMEAHAKFNKRGKEIEELLQ
jgi:predicted ATP-grasp superfamily ATP-dependent carboligase